jgi:hypothetical protein
MHPPKVRTKGQSSGRRTGLSRPGQGAARSSPQTLGGPARRPAHRLIVAQRWSGFLLSDHPNSRRKEGSLDLRENKGFPGGQGITTTHLPVKTWPSLSDSQDLSGLQIGCQQKNSLIRRILSDSLSHKAFGAGLDGAWVGLCCLFLDEVGGPEHAGAAPARRSVRRPGRPPRLDRPHLSDRRPPRESGTRGKRNIFKASAERFLPARKGSWGEYRNIPVGNTRTGANTGTYRNAAKIVITLSLAASSGVPIGVASCDSTASASA